MRRRDAFTLIELLVVVAIITLLIALLLPAMRRARLTAQIAVCASNFHQTVAVTISYAADNRGALPSHNFPDGIGRNPNAMAKATALALADRGLHWPQWFCPVRGWAFGPPPWSLKRTPISDTDALNQMAVFSSNWVLWPNFWWIPRMAGNGPVPSMNGQTYSVLPVRVSSSVKNFPIITDWMEGWSGGQPDPSDPHQAWGGHPWNGGILNINRGMLDGSVDQRTPDQVQPMIEAGLWWNWY